MIPTPSTPETSEAPDAKTPEPKPVVQPDRCLSPRQLARWLAVSPTKVLGWIHAGKLRAADVGGVAGKPRWRIAPAEVERFLAGRLSAPAPAPKRRRERRPEGWEERY